MAKHTEKTRNNINNGIFILILLIGILYLIKPNPILARTFRVEGSDLLMGVEGEGIAQGGAMVASTNNLYAIYWNPAGLAELENFQLSLSRSIIPISEANLADLDFIGAAVPITLLSRMGIDSTIAYSKIPRVFATAKGKFTEDEVESMFLRQLLLSLPGNFYAEITSKTNDHRFSFAMKPDENDKWSAGVTLVRIICNTSMTGIENTKNTEKQATAWGVNLGGKIFLSDSLSIGAHVRDINTILDVVSIEKVKKEGTTSEVVTNGTAEFPTDITVGFQWEPKDSIKTEFDLQSMEGKYGRYEMNFKILRMGLTLPKLLDPINTHFGAIFPLKLKMDSIGDLVDKAPFPFLPTMGFSWNSDNLILSTALYASPIMTITEKRIYPVTNVTAAYSF